MKIKTSHDYPPIPTRDADWSAVTDDYDGAEDAGPQCVGYGATEREAIEDLMEQLADEAYERGYKDAERISAKQGTTNGGAPHIAFDHLSESGVEHWTCRRCDCTFSYDPKRHRCSVPARLHGQEKS